MLHKAIEKINKEIKASKDTNIAYIGAYLLQQIEVNENAVEKILQGDKTIAGSLKEMEKVARKKKSKGMVVLTDAEGFEIVRKYFGFEAIQDKILEVEVSNIKEDYKSTEVKNDVSFKVNLRDLLK